MSAKNSCLVQSYRTIKTILALCSGFDMLFQILFSSFNSLQVSAEQSVSFKSWLAKMPCLSTLEQVLPTGVSGNFKKIISIP